jgi:hypothetical protein
MCLVNLPVWETNTLPHLMAQPALPPQSKQKDVSNSTTTKRWNLEEPNNCVWASSVSKGWAHPLFSIYLIQNQRWVRQTPHPHHHLDEHKHAKLPYLFFFFFLFNCGCRPSQFTNALTNFMSPKVYNHVNF